jgi:CheY-like chemotaxis protein
LRPRPLPAFPRTIHLDRRAEPEKVVGLAQCPTAGGYCERMSPLKFVLRSAHRYRFSQIRKTMIKVFVADDSSAMRAAIQILLEKQPDIRVVGEAADYDRTFRLLAGKEPDVLICDLLMPSGPKSQPIHVAELARACKCAVIAVTFAVPDAGVRRAAERLGAFRILDLTTQFATLVVAVREAVEGSSSSARA